MCFCSYLPLTIYIVPKVSFREVEIFIFPHFQIINAFRPKGVLMLFWNWDHGRWVNKCFVTPGCAALTRGYGGLAASRLCWLTLRALPLMSRPPDGCTGFGVYLVGDHTGSPLQSGLRFPVSCLRFVLSASLRQLFVSMEGLVERFAALLQSHVLSLMSPITGP
jgi:hypothetical protein